MRNTHVLCIMFVSLMFNSSLIAASLDLASYLEQVRVKNDEWKGSSLAASGAMMRSVEGLIFLSPSFFAEGSYQRNERETFSPSFQGTRTDTQHYGIGIGQQTTFGLNAKAGYTWGATHIFGTDSNFVRTPAYWEGSPYLELTQSLWRNSFGKEIKANQILIQSQALATYYKESFKSKKLLSDAEYTYWRLSLARENMLIQAESLGRSDKLKKWSDKQFAKNLIDQSDYYQAIASFESRKFEFESAKHEEAQASRAFNTFRNIEELGVSESLENISKLEIEKLELPDRMPYREDVLETQQLENVARSSAIIGKEQNKPKLELFGNITMYGRDQRFNNALDESQTNDHQAYTVGVRFQAAFDFDNVGRVKDGYGLEASASELRLRGKYFKQEQSWKDLNLQFKEAKIRLNIALAAEKAQRKKVEFERTKHARGRTTVYQVVQFEQDYANTQLLRIRSQVQVIDLFTELKTFGANP